MPFGENGFLNGLLSVHGPYIRLSGLVGRAAMAVGPQFMHLHLQEKDAARSKSAVMRYMLLVRRGVMRRKGQQSRCLEEV